MEVRKILRLRPFRVSDAKAIITVKQVTCIGNILFSGSTDKESTEKEKMKMYIQKLTMIVLKAIALGVGTGVVVLSCLKQLDVSAAVSMLGLGLACLAIAQLSAKDQ